MVMRPYSANLQQAFRDTLQCPGAPKIIDDQSPVVPVAIVATASNGLQLLYISAAGAGTTIGGTVPANKIWRIFGIQFSLQATAVSYGSTYVGTQPACIIQTTALINQGAVSPNFNGYLKLTAGQTVAVNLGSVGDQGRACIYYTEENA